MAPDTSTQPAAPVPAETFGKLPVLVATPVDVGRLLRELESIDEALVQLSLRQPGTEVKMPKTSQYMDQIVSLNKLNLLQPADRRRLQDFLAAVKDKSPVLHISFNSEPNEDFTEKLMAWLRREIHPLLLITIGLQPTLGAGCVVRSTNKYFDLSLRQDFAQKTELLRTALARPSPGGAVA